RESVGLRKRIRTAIVDVQESPLDGSDPESTITIAKQLRTIGRPSSNRIPRRSPFVKPHDACARGDQQRAVVIFGERLQRVRDVGWLMQRQSASLPAPETFERRYPQTA